MKFLIVLLAIFAYAKASDLDQDFELESGKDRTFLFATALNQ